MKRPLKPCNNRNCPMLTREAYCKAHTHLQKESTREYNNNRDPQHKRFYNSKEWRTVRKRAIERDKGLCVLCKDRGVLTPFDHVDHIKEMKDRYDLRLHLENLQCLCLQCHNQKTNEEKRKRRGL